MSDKGAAYDVILGIVEAVSATLPEAPQGGTVRLSGGALHAYGYYVGGVGRELVYDSLVTLKGSEVRAFVADCTTDFVGWWVDSETGKIHIDWVNWFPRRPMAESVGRVRKEIAIYDIANAKDIRL